MFSGLIAHRARVASVVPDPRGGARLRIEAPAAIAEGVEPKDSIAIDGVCLTAVELDARTIAFDVVPETLARSSLGSLAEGQAVNLELSLRLGDRLGGHFVYGHVDAAVRIAGVAPEGQGVRMRIELPAGLRRFVVEKGYVALDGVSLTVASAGAETFEIALIPETLARTTLGARCPGDVLNLEIDPIARYAVAAATPA
jgi:riboflavin synthase